MFQKNSLMTRIAVGKLVGLAVGLIGFVILPWLWPDAPYIIRWGVLLWYTTLGGIIGVFGVFTWHPMLKIPMPWWLRDPFIGGWMNFVLVLFAWDWMDAALTSMFGPDGLFDSPLWLIVEGALIGLLIGYLATKFGGEGKDIVDQRP